MTLLKRPVGHTSLSLHRPSFLVLGLSLLLSAMATQPLADVDPDSGSFSYSGFGGIDDTLGQIALYLLDSNRREGTTYISREVEVGIVGFQLRYFDNGNQLVDKGDWFSIRRYRIPADPDPQKPEGYYKSDFMEFVDLNLDGVDNGDYYFLDGRRFDLINLPSDMLKQYEVQIESGVTAFVKEVGYQTILQDLGSSGQTAIKKDQAFEDGSLPSKIVLGLDLKYVFRPIERGGTKLAEQQMLEEIRGRVGFVYSATTGYTDFSGYRFRDIADQLPLLQRLYDPMEVTVLTLIMDTLFDTNRDGIVTAENIKNGYTRFRELHQQVIESVGGLNRRIVLPSDKLSRLRQEYENLHSEPFKLSNES